MKTHIIKLIFSSLLFSSCLKEELPVAIHKTGDVTRSEVNMEESYKWQIYFDLKTNTVAGQNLKTAWDLGFESGSDGHHIILNSAKTMFAYNTGQNLFTQVIDTAGYAVNRRWDAPSGSYDSTAIGDWQILNTVYIVDRGYDEMGNFLGFRKIQILDVDDEKYTVRFAHLNGDGDTHLQIMKDDNYNLSFLSFTTGATLQIEPPKDQWDLVFTQYTHVFYDPLQTYLVTGCLHNRYNTSVAVDSIMPFESIAFDKIQHYNFSNNINTIGYNWKTFEANYYSTKSNLNYIIRDSEGYYYKLHFIDFYNESGVKGNPTWEFQKL